MGVNPITDEWLRESGFKWHQLDRQPSKHWVLWIGGLSKPSDPDSLGIELAWSASTHPDFRYWFCWLRADYAGRYSRLLHVRHLYETDEVERLFEGLTGKPWKPANHFYGRACSDEDAERYRRDAERLDVKLALQVGPLAERDELVPNAGDPSFDPKISR